MPKNRLLLTITIAILAAVFLAVAYFAPISHEKDLLFVKDRATESVWLDTDTKLGQSFEARAGRLSGISLFTQVPVMTDQKVRVRILDAAGEERVVTNRFKKTYLEADDTLILHFHFIDFATYENEKLKVEISLLEGRGLPVRVSNRNMYGKGAAFKGEEELEGDVAIDILYAAVLNDEAKRGALVGVVLMVGVGLTMLYVPKRWQWLFGAGWLAVSTPLFLYGFITSIGNLGISDWDLYFSYHEIVRRTVLDWRVFPFWNPWLCGGTAGLADPEFPLFTVTFLLELLFGIPWGFRLAICLSIAVTAIGMLYLAKRLRFSFLASMLTAVAGSFGGVTIIEIVEGHPNVFSAMWIPWIFWAWLAAYRKNVEEYNNSSFGFRLWPFICGVFLALTFYAGGIYLLSYTGLALVLLNFLVRKPLKAFRTTLVAGLWALGLAAMKLIPVLVWLGQFPDKDYASSAFTLPFLNEIFFGRNLHDSYVVFQQGSGWHEYGAYIGVAVFLMALVGATQLYKSRIVRGLVIAAIASTVLSSVGPALKPVFDQLPFIPRSNISRFILFAVIPISLLAGFGLDYLTITFPEMILGKLKKKSRLVAQAAALLMVGLISVDIMSFSAQLSEQAFVLPDVIRRPKPAPYPLAFTTENFSFTGQGDRQTRSYAAIREGYGTLTYCSVLGPTPMVRTIFDEGDNGIAIVTPKTTSAKLIYWSPNKAIFNVLARERSKLVLNTNYAVGWLTNGQPALIDSGRVAAEVEAGETRLEFVFKTAGFKAGFVITILSLLIALYFIRNNKKKV